MIDDKFSYNTPFQVLVASDREKEMYNTVSNLLTSFRNLANHYDGLSLEIKNVGSIVDMVNKSGLYGLEFYFDSQIVGTLWFSHRFYGASFDESWGLKMNVVRDPKKSKYVKELGHDIERFADLNGKEIRNLRIN